MKNKLWFKILLWVLIVLMVGSCGVVALTSLFPVSAAEPVDCEPDYITAGLMYGSDVTVGFETVSTVGFAVHSAVTEGERSLTEIYKIENPKVSVVCDDSLSKSAYTYSLLSGKAKCAVGGFHLEVRESFSTLEKAEEMLARIKKGLKAEKSDMKPFIAYINGKYKVRLGNFSVRAGVKENASTIPNLKTEITMVAALPSETALSVVDPETDEILFEYDCGKDSCLALTALDKNGEKQYLRTPAKRLYDGAFVYSRYQSGTVDGVQLVNMLDIEDYIAGVVPYEINPEWEYEALRCFAITVRSYTAKSKNRHASAYGFDICNTTHCQVYRGIASANENVFKAVESTRGIVVAYEGKIAPIYYSSSTGGCTVRGYDTWGGSENYNTAVETLWERYSEHNNGLWTSEVTGAELADYLRSKGYDKITGKRIVDIEINELAEGSSYVYSITFTDSSGNELTVKRCDKVRTSVSKYVNSANFVVGKGSVTYSYDKVRSINIDDGFTVITGNYQKAATKKMAVISADGVVETKTSQVSVLTGDGVADTYAKGASVATADSKIYTSAEGEIGVRVTRVTETVTASDKNSFVFAGKGWGHGVGTSQYGTKDLAEAGATAEKILSLYFPGTELRDYRTLGEDKDED